MSGVVVSFPVATSVLTTPRLTHAPFVDHRSLYMPSFTMLIVSRDSPYGMSTTMMSGLQRSASTCADNNATITSPLNPYVASGSSISHYDQATQHGGPLFSPPNMYILTKNSMLSIRQKIDESNHEMINMPTQQIATVFNPVIQNTNQSYQ